MAKYIQTSDTEAMITDTNNKPLGEVENEDAKVINDRITKCKNIFANR